MDATVGNTEIRTVGSPQTWDFTMVGDIVPIIYDETETSQQATVTAFTQKGLIPQVLNAGIDWLGLMSGDATLNEIDMAINDALLQNGKNGYAPYYSLKNEALSVTIRKSQTIKAI